MGKEHDAAQTTTAYGELPEFPGSDFLAHHATTWLENATAKLGDLKLLAVADAVRRYLGSLTDPLYIYM